MQAIVEAIHASPTRCVLYATGAGGTALSLLLSVAGCSKTLLDGRIPYHPNVTRQILDQFPSKFVSVEIGRQLSFAAYCEARKIVPATDHAVVGIGATASVRTDHVPKGGCMIFVSAWQEDKVVDYKVVMSGERTRAEQEDLCSSVILKALADASQVPFSHDMKFNPQEEKLEEFTHLQLPNPIQSLLTGQVNCTLFNSHGHPRLHLLPYSTENVDAENAIYLLYPGSFQPLHWGHTELARIAAEVMQREQNSTLPVIITYEISASIVGKKDLHEADFWSRVQQFTEGGRRVALTTAKFFVDKARMFPYHGLVMGVDTARRVIDPQYYGNSEQQMIEAMKEIASYHCYFVVGGRKIHGDQWDDLTTMTIPEEIKFMFKAIKPEDFRVDISSTEIRARKGTPPSSEIND